MPEENIDIRAKQDLHMNKQKARQYRYVQDYCRPDCTYKHSEFRQSHFVLFLKGTVFQNLKGIGMSLLQNYRTKHYSDQSSKRNFRRYDLKAYR